MKRINIFGLWISRFSIIIALLLWGNFVVISCAPKPKILPQNRTPENVWRCAQENIVEFKTMACLIDLKLKGKNAKFSGTVEFLYDSSGTFAFYPRPVFGIDVFKAGGKDDSLTIYFPKENEYHAGLFSDLEKTRLWSWKIPLKMLLDMILEGGGLREEIVEYGGNEKDLFLYKLEEESWIKEYWVDARRCRLTRSRVTPRGGEEVYEIKCNKFAKYDQMEIPRVVKIKTRTGESAQIKFLERRFNFSIPEKKLKLQIPPEAKRVDFESRKQ